MAAPLAAAPVVALAIVHSDAENARMDAEMDGLSDPVLKWYKCVRYAPQPTFERREGQIRLVACASPLETYAPFIVVRLEGEDLIASCLLCPPGRDRAERRLTQKKSMHDPARKLQTQKIVEHIAAAHRFILTFTDAAAAAPAAGAGAPAIGPAGVATAVSRTARELLSAPARRAYDERFVRMVVLCGGISISFSLAESVGWQEWCAAEKLPLVPERTARRVFEGQFEKYRADILKLIRRLRTPAIIECGSEGVLLPTCAVPNCCTR